MSSQHDPGVRPPDSPPKRPRLPVSRIVLGLLLVAVIVVAVFEFRARWSRSASYEAIGAEMEACSALVPKKDVKALLRGSYTRLPDEQSACDIVTWRGVFGRYGFRIEYQYDGVAKIAPLEEGGGD